MSGKRDHGPTQAGFSHINDPDKENIPLSESVQSLWMTLTADENAYGRIFKSHPACLRISTNPRFQISERGSRGQSPQGNVGRNDLKVARPVLVTVMA